MNKLILVICCALAAQAFAQIPAKRDNKLKQNFLQVQPQTEERREGVQEVFSELEKLIADGSMKPLVGYIGSQVYLNINGGDQGYFSSNQALSLLESYFVQRKPMSFRLLNVNQRAPSPFATGKLEYVYKGNKESAQVYIALTKRDSIWVMTQLTIY